jgi:hypothetical protein
MLVLKNSLYSYFIRLFLLFVVTFLNCEFLTRNKE